MLINIKADDWTPLMFASDLERPDLVNISIAIAVKQCPLNRQTSSLARLLIFE